MLDQRRRRWANINTTLGRCAFAVRTRSVNKTLARCWLNVGPACSQRRAFLLSGVWEWTESKTLHNRLWNARRGLQFPTLVQPFGCLPNVDPMLVKFGITRGPICTDHDPRNSPDNGTQSNIWFKLWYWAYIVSVFCLCQSRWPCSSVCWLNDPGYHPWFL